MNKSTTNQRVAALWPFPVMETCVYEAEINRK